MLFMVPNNNHAHNKTISYFRGRFIGYILFNKKLQIIPRHFLPFIRRYRKHNTVSQNLLKGIFITNRYFNAALQILQITASNEALLVKGMSET